MSTFENIIKSYLAGRCKEDEVFAQKYLTRCADDEDKAISDCCSYITSQAKKKAHDEQLAIRQRINENIRKEQERKRAIELADKLCEDGKTNVEYIARMGAYFGVVIKRKNIELRPLQSVREFFEEGNELNHCVFMNKYYEHKDCLILSARVDGKRTETIEIDTKSWKIAQCRGKHNQNSKYHDMIVKLMKDNMNKLRQCI